MAIGLGSNRGDRAGHLRSAIDRLRRRLSDPLIGPLVRSAPEGGGDQRHYFNTVIVGGTRLGPDELLAELKALEWAAGRRPAPRNAPRPLDLDLLLYGEVSSRRPELTLPHPRLARRAFALVPLAAVAATWRVPPAMRPVAELLAELGPEPGVEPLPWPGPAAPTDRRRGADRRSDC